MIYATLIAAAITITASIAGQSPQSTNPAAAENKASTHKPPVEILSHRISPEHYPILDRENTLALPMTAETGGLPRMRNEPSSSYNRYDVPPEEVRREQGRLRSFTRIVDNAQQVQAVVKNTGAKPIEVVEWDFAFPRYDNGQFISRYSVTTKVGIKPGGKKTLKYRLPPGAKRCEVGRVIAGKHQPVNRIEVVCAQNFHYLPLLNLKQEQISIKRIEYSDGSIWLKQ
jgi:hypothetical protein